MSRPHYGWWGYVKDIIRRYPSAVTPREYEAVRAAIEQTERMSNGYDRLKIVDLVFWKRTHTLPGSALLVPCSERAAQRWHAEFIKTVARNFGLLD